MKMIFTAAFALLFGQFLTAQTSITGALRDENHEPLPFAAVQLFDAATNQPVENGATDGYGIFKFDGIAAGKYFIRAKSAALGEVISKKMTVCALPVELPDLFFPKNTSARAKKSAFAELPHEKLADDELVVSKE